MTEPTEKNGGTLGKAHDESQSAAPEATVNDIPRPPTEMQADELAKSEGKVEEIENRAQSLASNLLEQKHKLQGHVFYVVIVVICTFYVCFLLTVTSLVCSPGHEIFKKEFSATATVLIAMLGSIPTILMAFLMTGLFREKDPKEKDEKSSSIDVSTAVKLLSEIAKVAK